MARVYDQGAIDSTYEFMLKIKSIFNNSNTHSAEELKGLIVLILFVDYVRNEGLAHIDWINWNNKEVNYKELHAQLSTDLLSKNTLMGVICQIEKQIPALKGVFDELINLKADFVDEAVIKKIINALWWGYPEQSDDLALCFTEVIYELYSDNVILNTDTDIFVDSSMNHFITYRENMRIYNPFSSLGGLLLNWVEDINCIGTEADITAFNLSRLLLFVNKANNSRVYNIDVFADNKDTIGKFDTVICRPPFALKSIKVVKHCLDSLNEQGEAIILLPRDFLNSTDEEELAFRKHLVDNNLIEYVITLPYKHLTHTSVNTAIVVLNKAPRETESIIMIDLSIDYRLSNFFDDGLRKVKDSLETEAPWGIIPYSGYIAAHHYNLIPNLYLLAAKREKVSEETGYKPVKLKDILEPSKIDVNDRFRFKNGDPIIRLAKEYDNSVVKDWYDIDGDEYSDYDWDDDKPRYHRMVSKSLLIAKSRTNPNATYYIGREDEEEFINEPLYTCTYYDSHESYSFTLTTDDIKVDYLLAELRKDYVKQQWDCYLTETGVAVDDLLQIEIQVPESLEQQERNVTEFREFLIKQKLEEHESIVKELKKRHEEDLRSKRHNIMQHLNNIDSLVDNLNWSLEQNHGVLNVTDVISAEQNLTVGSSLDELQDSLRKTIFFIDNLTNDIPFHPAEIISLDSLLNPLIKKAMTVKANSDLFDISYLKEPEQSGAIKISFSKVDFEELFNNIVENACKHSFVDKDKQYTFRIRLVPHDDENKISVFFENDGKPFPEGAGERYRTKFEKAGNTGNEGIGGWRVNQLAEHFDGKVVVHALKKGVKIELILPII